MGMDDGKTETTIKGKKSTSLPVGTESSKCFRYNNFVKCIFEKAGLKVYVDLDNKVTTFYLSGWHHGKTRGILGTNNREEYDDWKMPKKGCKQCLPIRQLIRTYQEMQRETRQER